MVAYCCVCKTEQGAIPNVSFHTIPKDETAKAKWFINIGREVSKRSSVCSRHFEEKDFHYKLYGNDVRRYLLPAAYPCLLLTQTDRESKHSESSIQLPAPERELSVLRDRSNLLNTCNDSSTLISSKNHTLSATAPINLKDEQTLAPGDTHSKVDTHEKKDENDENKTFTLKREMSEAASTSKSKRIRSTRYIGDLTREDFTSDRSWQIVNDYVKNSKSREKVLKQKVKRLSLKIESLDSLLKHLKGIGLLTSEGCSALELSTSPAVYELIKNVLSSKKPTYPLALKEFACTLLFYSTSAYEYVRNTFMKALPHPQTVRKWFTKIDFSPGISQPVLDNLKKMIDEYKSKGIDLQFGMQVDEMSIKKGIEWDGKKYHGHVDLGLDEDETEEATYALVIMLVCLNGHFKTPISYYFIKGLTAEVRANILQQVLTTLYENGIANIKSITFDGASTNLSMVKQLGADLNDITQDAFFEHPVTKEHIVAVPDACHMLKLTRNTLSEYDIIDGEGNRIQWKYLERLVDQQEKEMLHPGTKIRRRHINFQKEKMKVKLAAQTLSNGSADGLLFMKEKFPDKFEGVEATSKFCRKINDIFDFLNSRKKFSKNDSQKCLSRENYAEMEKKVNEYIEYIKGLKIVENNNAGAIPILSSRRKTGFWGLIVAMKSILKLARGVFENECMDYILTYKLSQDHLETFFSCIRRMGGFNNNPTCRQFRSSYKKTVTHVNSIVPSEANCSLQDSTKLLKCNSTMNSTHKDNSSTETETKNLFNVVAFEHDYVGTNGWLWNEYRSETVTYIAGSIVRSMRKKIRCEWCLSQLESDQISSKLIKLKNRVPVHSTSTTENCLKPRRGLISPSNDVVTICKTAERTLRSTTNLFSKNVLDRLLIHAKMLLLDVQLFPELDMLVEHTVLSNHKLDLIDIILKKYFNIRLHHEATCSQDAVQRIRNFHNRLVLFKNQ